MQCDLVNERLTQDVAQSSGPRHWWETAGGVDCQRISTGWAREFGDSARSAESSGVGRGGDGGDSGDDGSDSGGGVGTQTAGLLTVGRAGGVGGKTRRWPTLGSADSTSGRHYFNPNKLPSTEECGAPPPSQQKPEPGAAEQGRGNNRQPSKV